MATAVQSKGSLRYKYARVSKVWHILKAPGRGSGATLCGRTMPDSSMDAASVPYYNVCRQCEAREAQGDAKR